MTSLSESCTAEPSNVHRLVIVEGIMGLGKSTTMRFIAKHLQEAGRPAVHIHERIDPHPVRATDELEHWFEPWRDATPKDLADRALARWTAFVEYTLTNPALILSAADTGTDIISINGLSTIMAERVEIVGQQLAILANNCRVTLRRVMQRITLWLRFRKKSRA